MYARLAMLAPIGEGRVPVAQRALAQSTSTFCAGIARDRARPQGWPERSAQGLPMKLRSAWPAAPGAVLSLFPQAASRYLF